MLGNIIGGFIVILVGTALLPTVNTNAHFESNFLMLNPEYRLKALRSSDRGDTHFDFAVTTNKGFQSGRRYSLVSCNKMKHEFNTNEHNKWELHKLTET